MAAASRSAQVWCSSCSGGWRRLLGAIGIPLTIALAMDFVEGLDRDHPWHLWARLAAKSRDPSDATLS